MPVSKLRVVATALRAVDAERFDMEARVLGLTRSGLARRILEAHLAGEEERAD